MKVSWFGLIWCKIFTSLISVSQCTFEQRIQVRKDELFIKYEHQLHDNTCDFTQTINTTMFHGVAPANCSTSDRTFCLRWGGFAEFALTTLDESCDSYDYKTELDAPLTVVFNLSTIHLYGGDEVENQSWPLKTAHRTEEPFVAKQYNSEGALEPIWYTSTGFYLHVAQNVPLFVRLHRDALHLVAERRAPYARRNVTRFSYKICKYENVRVAFERAIGDTLGRPAAPPNYKTIELPTWSTWAKYKGDVNESTVQQFADLVSSHLFPGSQLAIDDRWETCRGSLTVDRSRFPLMRRLVRRLHAKGYAVTLWAHPFVDVDCRPYFADGVRGGYFVGGANGSAVTAWSNGRGACVDFANAQAADWYATRLKKVIAETGVDSFKFDAGEGGWRPRPSILGATADDQPEANLRRYIQVAASFGRMVEVRSARQTQRYPIFVRMLDRETQWTGRRAASTLIPTLLHLNVIGYPFVLPDVIGGNGYGADALTEEMFVRWLQITVFMPALQFSYPPWDFSDKVVNITRGFVDLHKSYAPTIYKLMKRATKEATMVNAPLWWIDPTDPITFTIDSEFLLGDEILVAPILEKGATSRNIYFPKGLWRDETNKSSPLIIGPTWVHNYPADLEVLPYFTRLSNGVSCVSSIFRFIQLVLLSLVI